MIIQNKLLTTAVLIITSGLIQAGEINLGNINISPSDWLSYGGEKTQITTIIPTGIEVKGKLVLFSKKFIPVNTGKRYRLSGSFQCAPNTKPNRFFFGFQPFNAKRKPILPTMVGRVFGTETKLAAPCKKTDKTIIVFDASMWTTGVKYCIAFGVNSAGSDIPNRKLSSLGIKTLKAVDDKYEVELKKPCNVNAPTGTKVRLHKTSNTFMYSAAIYSKVPTKWKDFSGTVNSQVAYGSPKDAWWSGTKMCRIVILTNSATGGSNAKLQFKNIKIEELEASKK
jgi:hypothetical protein